MSHPAAAHHRPLLSEKVLPVLLQNVPKWVHHFQSFSHKFVRMGLEDYSLSVSSKLVLKFLAYISFPQTGPPLYEPFSLRFLQVISIQMALLFSLISQLSSNGFSRSTSFSIFPTGFLEHSPLNFPKKSV